MNLPDTAPRDGTVIAAHFGTHWLGYVPAVWNEYECKWAIPNLQSCPMENGKSDTYWETELEPDAHLLGWLPMPKIEEKGDRP
jgi:hypothetical protein